MLITLRNISLRFSAEPVLDGINLSIESGDRIALVGRNGAGKSTLLRLIAGRISADSGEREHSETLRIAWLDQDTPPDLDGRVYDLVTRGLGPAGRLLLAYARAVHEGSSSARLMALQQTLEAGGAWHKKAQVQALLSRMGLNPEARFAALSGGLKRQVMLAEALVGEPDLLLLDEPTNHLDIAGITWLERWLQDLPCALVLISHDRTFLDRITTRIIEVDRGKLHAWPGSYAEYHRCKLDALRAEDQAHHEFDKKLAEEELWLHQGVKARTKRNRGRVRTIEAMRKEAAARRKYRRRIRLRAQFGEESSRRVIEAHRLNVSIDGKTILRDFTHKIRRGDVIGIMGPNSCGKTTLLRVLLGEHPPQSGTLKYGENLQIAYFDQNRLQLNLDRDAAWNVGDGAEHIDFEGKSLHIIGYLKAFLFSPDRARTRTRLLSGGERNRLLLARLFAKPSNVLILDEPTNDLDIETLELLETLILDYPGTVILVSHDRTFIDHVVDGILVHETDRGFCYYVGNYTDWLRQHKISERVTTPPRKSGTVSPARRKSAPLKKLSYKDQRELEALPAHIEMLENEISLIHQQLSDPEFFRTVDGGQIRDVREHLRALEKEHQLAFARWEKLEEYCNLPESSRLGG